jgi:hypothetical protein
MLWMLIVGYSSASGPNGGCVMKSTSIWPTAGFAGLVSKATCPTIRSFPRTVVAGSAKVNLYDPAHFEMPFTAHLDLRGSDKWNDNIEFYCAVDNFANVPPALIAPGSGQIQSNATDLASNLTTYDLLGRQFRLGVRFNY